MSIENIESTSQRLLNSLSKLSDVLNHGFAAGVVDDQLWPLQLQHLAARMTWLQESYLPHPYSHSLESSLQRLAPILGACAKAVDACLDDAELAQREAPPTAAAALASVNLGWLRRHAATVNERLDRSEHALSLTEASTAVEHEMDNLIQAAALVKISAPLVLAGDYVPVQAVEYHIPDSVMLAEVRDILVHLSAGCSRALVPEGNGNVRVYCRCAGVESR